jgi:hypothetical protein
MLRAPSQGQPFLLDVTSVSGRYRADDAFSHRHVRRNTSKRAQDVSTARGRARTPSGRLTARKTGSFAQGLKVCRVYKVFRSEKPPGRLQSTSPPAMCDVHRGVSLLPPTEELPPVSGRPSRSRLLSLPLQRVGMVAMRLCNLSVPCVTGIAEDGQRKTEATSALGLVVRITPDQSRVVCSKGKRCQ